MADSRRAAGRLRVVDRRDLPVVVLGREELWRLHATFTGRRVAVARSIYMAFVERVGAGDAECTRRELATDAGVTTKTLDEYVPLLIEAGLIEREHRHEDGVNLTNVWRLCRPGARGVARHADDPEQSSSLSSSANGEDEGRGEAACPPLALLPLVDVAPLLTTDLIEDAEALIERKTKVDGRMVTAQEMAIAATVVAEFNRQSGSEFGLGAHVRAIVGRVRERPSYTPDAHVRLVQSAWRLKWWERSGRGRRATPAVIYGNAGVFEQVVQDAVDEKKGVTRAADANENVGASRYDRED